MGLLDKIQQDLVAAMKAREEARLSTLRMIKAALKNKEIEKRGPLTDAEAMQVLSTLVKQRRDSIEQFTKGNRPELAAKEAAEIPILESYMPKAADAAHMRALVQSVIAEIAAAGARPTMKEMGSVMKAVQARTQAEGLRADGKSLSEIVKSALAQTA